MKTFLKYDWKFSQKNADDWENPDFDDTDWRTVRIPHDYAIEGPFDKYNDTQYVAIHADGIDKPIEHIGRTGGLPIHKNGWYRKMFTVQSTSRRVFLEFDGIMANSSVFVNGHYVDGRPFGYSSFSVEVTKFVNTGENLLAVQCAPEYCSSRWYTGAGIYRNVRLRETDEICLDYFSNYITDQCESDTSVLTNRAYILNENGKEIKVITEILDGDNVVATSEVTTNTHYAESTIEVSDIKRWDIDSPNLYKVITKLEVESKTVDVSEINYGFRTIRFDTEKGFFLNDRHVKIQGVCMHHDLGALGAALSVPALKRQLTILKSFGVNAIRTSHNPPAPELLDLCDEMGFVVDDEAFDEWAKGKVKNGYSKHFKKWHYKDLSEFVKRDRNHPSVIMWSTGNEIMDQMYPFSGGRVAAKLAKIVREFDDARPVTSGFNAPDAAIRNGLAKKIDIVGLNYQPKRYDHFKKTCKNKAILGSETSSCVSSRGEYYFPAVLEYGVEPKDTKLMSSYDLCGPGWACSPDEEFFYQDKYGFMMGEFVWTGFDYLGEPTPYNVWPCRSSFFGIVDLAGMPKDRYYSYKSKWSKEDTIHIFPHWNWEVGQKIDVHCYCNYDEVELFLNGKSLGIQKKQPDIIMKNHRLIWEGVEFEPGVLRAEAVSNRKVFDEVQTAGEPYALRLTPEKTEIQADGEDLVYIRCDVVDEKGVICPKASNKIDISVTGDGEYLVSDNGSQISTRVFSEKYCEAFNGSMMITARSIKGQTGELTVTVTSNALVIDTCSVLVK